jgi:hypothetical protein
MEKKIVLLLLCCFCLCSVWAQGVKKKSYPFHSINSLALVNGSNGVAAAMQSVNGFTKGPWFAGIGLGLDYYQYRTVPFFADLRYEVGQKRNKFFVYGDAGINFNWAQDYFYYESSLWNGNRSNNFNSGLYTDAGIGLSAGFKNGNAFILSLGCSRKTLKEKINYADWLTGKPQTDINTYRFNRIMVKAGFCF